MSLPHEAGEPVAYVARWVLTMDGPPLENGVVTVADGRIVEVGRSTSAQRVIDLGPATLMPGLINSHTHLELSSFDKPLGQPRQSFPEWIKEVVAWKRKQAAELPGEELAKSREAAVKKGLAESARDGVAQVADIASSGWSRDWYQGGRGTT